MCGAFGEQILCEHFGWEKIDADGYDALAPIGVSLGNVAIPNLSSDQYYKVEIKTMSNFTKTTQLAYDSEMKAGKYDYLAIYMYHEERVSIIPHDEVEKLLTTEGIGKTLNLNPTPKIVFGRQTDKIVYSPLTELFLKYEIKGFNGIGFPKL
jgi:hypothetical protein